MTIEFFLQDHPCPECGNIVVYTGYKHEQKEVFKCDGCSNEYIIDYIKLIDISEKTCPQCGNVLTSDYEFCNKCGGKL